MFKGRDHTKAKTKLVTREQKEAGSKNIGYDCYIFTSDPVGL